MGSNNNTNRRRRLADLYVLGTIVKVDDGQGDPVEVWIQKLNPVDHDRALKRANAERAKVLSLRSTPDSIDYLAMEAEVHDLGGRDTLIDYLASEDIAKAQISREAELAGEDEWAKEGYLDGLRDAWQETLADAYAANPEEPEALRVFNELTRFNNAVEKAASGEADAIKRDFEGMATEEMQKRVMDRMLDLNGDLAFMREFRRCEVFFSAREPQERRERYFTSREEIDELSLEVLAQLLAAYRDLTVEVSDAKKSQEEPASSNS